MNNLLAPPSATTSMRRWLARTWDDPESRSTLVGLVGVVLFYLLLWLVGPHLLRFDHVPGAARPNASAQQFDIELAPDAFVKPEAQPEPFKFVETNPDAPENTPDNTQNFGAQNQQVAQEKPTPDGRSDRPATEGEKDHESTQIVSGQLLQPIEEMEAVPEVVTPREDTTIAAQRAEQIPLPGFDKTEGENKTTYGSNIAKIPESPAQAVPEHVEGAKGVPLIEGLTAIQPVIDPLRPQPRPQLVKQPQTRPAILAENNFGTDRVGPIAYDARWSNYGTYLQRLVNSVQIQWERILVQSRVIPAPGLVTVKFRLDSEGKIARIVEVDSSTAESATRACVSAISDRAPYGVWTDDMRAMLGEEQEMTFRFVYQ